MPIAEHIDVKRPRPNTGGGGPGKIPRQGGYGGDDGGGDDGPDDFVSSRDRLRRYRVVLVSLMVSISVLFALVVVVYYLRGTGINWDEHLHGRPHWAPLPIPYIRLSINTLVLALSSLTLELARRSMLEKLDLAEMGIVPPGRSAEPWMAATVALGFGFLLGQILLWNFFRRQGLYFNNNIRADFMYAITGLHAVHLLGGLSALIFALFGRWFHASFQSQRLTTDATAWYWHFMGILWICIFAALHFAN